MRSKNRFRMDWKHWLRETRKPPQKPLMRFPQMQKIGKKRQKKKRRNRKKKKPKDKQRNKSLRIPS